MTSTRASFDKPFFARAFQKVSAANADVDRPRRVQLLEGLMGRVIEIGAGHGLNFSHYPSTVTEVLAVEPESTLRSLAERAAADAPVRITVVAGTADELPAEGGSFDAAVASHVLCSMPDQLTGLREIRRVLRPGGELRFYEHVRAEGRPLSTVQRVMDVGWPHVAGGCHLSRDTASAIAAAGFEIDRCERFDRDAGLSSFHSKPHILGLARRP